MCRAIDLRAGDVLQTINGEVVIVEWVQHEILESPVKVYNFKVEVRTSNEHGVQHALVSGNGPNTTIGLDGKPMRNHPNLSKPQRKVVEENWEVIKYGILQYFPQKY